MAKLAKYNAKRDFKKTAEPSGKVSRSKSGFSYLIQKHAASRLHYDLRLELDGVLKSWAVTRGPSLDPHDKRLAVEVEDHPVSYGSFEGIIPEGEYGGGTVMMWDEGTWEPIGDPKKGLKEGSLKFNLHGKRLKGSWALVRMKDRDKDRHHNWLLIKHSDAFAKAGAGEAYLKKNASSVVSKRSMEEIAEDADRKWQSKHEPQATIPVKTKLVKKKPNPPKVKKLPAFLPPELATLADAMPSGANWLHEVKFDGYRILTYIENGTVRMLTRNGHDWTDKFGDLPALLAKLPVQNAIVDGELVVLDKKNVSSFAKLKNILSEGGDGLSYYVFDLLFLDGKKLTDLPLIERKALLEPLVADLPRVFYSEHFASEDGAFMQHACALGLEGVISKLANAPYHSGRGKSWLKTKCHKRQEFVIGGYTLPTNGSAGIGALLLGYYQGKKLTYAGRVGTGFDNAMSRALLKQLKPLQRKTMPYELYSDGGRRGTSWKRGVIWTEPMLVCEVEFTEWTEDGALRHPSFQGLREDKPAKDITRDVALPTAAATRAAKKETARLTKSKSNPAQHHEGEVVLSHPNKILFPDKGYTKQDLADYYVQVAEWMLPAIAGRPLSLMRCPAGAGQQCFFQRHAGEGLSPHIKTVTIGSEKKREPYLMIDDVDGLMALVQMGVLEIHNWGSHAKTWAKPDMIVFDFDPDENLPFSKVKDAALTIRKRLKKMKLESFVKTTGGKGLHVVVPFVPKYDWDTIKAFARETAEAMAAAEPALYTTNIRKTARKGRIFIDYLRNGETATAIAPYSTRARDGATVAVPLDWAELPALKSGNGWNIKTLPKRLENLKRDPWEAFYSSKQSLKLL